MLTHSFPPRRSSDLRVERFQTVHHHLADRARRNLALAACLELALDRGQQFVRSFLRHGPFAQRDRDRPLELRAVERSEEHTSELQSLMRISYAVFCLKKKKHTDISNTR